MRHSGLAALAALAAGLALPAGAQTITVVYDTDGALNASGAAESPVLQSTQQEWVDKIRRAQTVIQQKQEELERNRSTMSPEQIQARESEVRALIAEHDQMQKDAERAMENARRTVRSDFTRAADPALVAFAEQNQIGEILVNREDNDGAAFIVLTPDFDISSAIAAMTRAEDGAAVPAGPNRPPVIRYVRAMDVFSVSPGRWSAIEDLNEATSADRAELDVKQNELEQLIYARTMSELIATDKDKQLSNTRIELASLRTSLLREALQKKGDERRGAMVARFKTALSEWMAEHPDIVRADIVCFLDDESIQGTLIVANPHLDITDDLMAYFDASEAPAPAP